MDVTYDLLLDPLYNPLFPSIGELTEYVTELYNESNNITFEWATNEVVINSLGYIRVGLVADVVRRYKIYKHPQDKVKQCRCFREYCEKILGKTEWYVNKIIDAAKTALALIKNGCPLEKLPTCEFQMRPLAKIFLQASKAWDKFWDVEQCDMSDDAEPPPNPNQILVDKWQQVIDSVPPHRITGNKIAEIVEDNPQPPAKRKIEVRTVTREQWERMAREAGMTPDDYLEAILKGEIQISSDTEKEPDPEQEQVWLEDVNNLVEEYDKGSSTKTTETDSPDNGERTVGDDVSCRYLSRRSSKTTARKLRHRRRT